VAGVFGPGTNIAKAASQILEVLIDQHPEEMPVEA
jgi:methylmalonyl-CoA mutase